VVLRGHPGQSLRINSLRKAKEKLFSSIHDLRSFHDLVS